MRMAVEIFMMIVCLIVMYSGTVCSPAHAIESNDIVAERALSMQQINSETSNPTEAAPQVFPWGLIVLMIVMGFIFISAATKAGFF